MIVQVDGASVLLKTTHAGAIPMLALILTLIGDGAAQGRSQYMIKSCRYMYTCAGCPTNESSQLLESPKSRSPVAEKSKLK